MFCLIKAKIVKYEYVKIYLTSSCHCAIQNYSMMEDFHSHLPRILKDDGVYSFYNGCCPDNLFFHGVACEVIKLELQDLGLTCSYQGMEVNVTDQKMWDKVRRRYWYRNYYYVPICKKMEILDCT